MNDNQFEIYIDYDKEADNPERVFLTLARLVSEFANFDNIICESLAVKVQSKMVLDKVENGSIKAFFTQCIESIDDESLTKLDWKGIIGHILVQSKYKLLDALKDKPDNKTVDIKNLQDSISELSKPLIEGTLKTNNEIPPFRLAKCLDGVNNAFGNLTLKDKVKYITNSNSIDTHHNSNFSMAYEKAQLIEKDLINTYNAILVVKKPDFLSNSQWEFKYNDKCINATIADEQWLSKFQNREINLQAKDSIECSLQIQTKDVKGTKTEITYTVVKVHKVKPYEPPKQLNIEEQQL